MDSSWRRVADGIAEDQPDTMLVRLSRTLEAVDAIEGYVLTVAPKWTLIAKLDDCIFINGYAVVRTADIDGLESSEGVGSFVQRALALQEEWPPSARRPTDIDLAENRTLLRSVRKRQPVCCIYNEVIAPGACFCRPSVSHQRAIVRTA
jgi:hypothetical protein